MVGPFEQTLLALMTFAIMLGMGASLTPRDFYLALRRPYGLGIGLVSQYGLMPLIGFVLATLLAMPPALALGLLIIACMPGGMTSNIFTYFSKGNLALSMLMTVASTVAGVIMIPLLLLLYAAALDLDIPRENVILTLLLLLLPVAFGMVLRRLNAKVGAAAEFFGSVLAVFFIVLLMATWVPRNWAFLLGTSPSTYAAAIGLGVIGFALGYAFSRLLRLHPRNARTVALETGIQNGPLAITIIALTFPMEEAQEILVVPVLYSLFIVIVATLITLIFRRANTAGERHLSDGPQ
jgi:bile acid:Na+ symporter, BASS family